METGSQTQYFKLEEARDQLGDRVDYYWQALHQMDPLADDAVAALATLPVDQSAKILDTTLKGSIEKDSTKKGSTEAIADIPDVPEALTALLDHMAHVPWWVNWDSIDRGGQLCRQMALPIMLLLGFYALPATYTSPAGNKPLVSTRYFVDRAPLRLAETLSFVRLTCAPNSLRPSNPGFRIHLKVRLMHAQVRRLLLRSGRWKVEEWALPINQAHMAGTLVAISANVFQKLKDLGFRFSAQEIEDVLHLWRYAGYLSGVREALLCSTLGDARMLTNLILSVEGAPDQDSRALMKALRNISRPPGGLEKPSWLANLRSSLVRVLLGDAIADSLAIPKVKERFFWPPVLWGLSVIYWVLFRVPGGRSLAEWIGKLVWGRTEGILFSMARKARRRRERA